MGFDPQPSVGPLSEAALHGLNVDRDLLTRQAALLGKVLNAASLNAEEHSCLGGLWEFVHNVLDLMDGA
jgi:hypothetical protein